MSKKLYWLMVALRPHQWIKNVFVFAAIVFSHEAFHLTSLLLSVGAFVVFSLASSCVYLFNDLQDLEEDRHHPQKRNRPLASGKVTKQVAQFTAVVLLVGVIFLVFTFYSYTFGAIIGLYLAINLLYSVWLKKIVIVDLVVVAIGFVLRAMAGALAIDVYISPWLLTATFFLALFLILGKRRHEILLLGEGKEKHRAVLGEYSQMMVDSMLVIVTTVTIVMYVLYTLSPRTIAEFGTDGLFYTVVFVVYGIFRAFYLIYEKNKGGAPTEMLLTDKPLQINLLLWLIIILLIVYHDDFLTLI